MKKDLLLQYLKSPCSVASIPYWKQKSISIPNNMIIVHNKDFLSNAYADYIDEPYFRLYHDLKQVEQPNVNGIEIVVATPDMIGVFVEIINASYDDLSVTKEQMESYRQTPVFNPDLWILLKDKDTGDFVGGGIADYDSEICEAIIEWVQVLPSYRGRGYGQIVVNYLLSKMQGIAKFATVSGKVNNSANPEKLYRKCGFTGNDIWHILCKK